MNKKTTITLLFLFVLFFYSRGQSLTLDECYRLAESNYPLVKQYDLIDKSQDYSLSNASKGYLPQFMISSQATYQSDVTKMPFSLPDADVPTLSKDQYRIQGEIIQPITDIFTTIKHKKDIVINESETERNKIDVEMHKIRERINQLYFGILLIDAQVEQIELTKKDIQFAINKNGIAIVNGVALKSSGDMLNAELLKVEQRTIEMNSIRKGFIEMLSMFINKEISKVTPLEIPIESVLISEINRPEVKMFDSQKRTIQSKGKMLDVGIMPRLNIFAQVGYGKPALNMLANDFDYYYVGGVRLTWNISNFYTHKKEKKILSNNINSIDIQKETFLFNIELDVTRQNNEIEKLYEIIESDHKIIELRENIRITAQNQLEFGTVTTNDFLTYINAEDQAKQNLIYHEMQILAAKYNLKTTVGN